MFGKPNQTLTTLHNNPSGGAAAGVWRGRQVQSRGDIRIWTRSFITVDTYCFVAFHRLLAPSSPRRYSLSMNPPPFLP